MVTTLIKCGSRRSAAVVLPPSDVRYRKRTERDDLEVVVVGVRQRLFRHAPCDAPPFKGRWNIGMGDTQGTGPRAVQTVVENSGAPIRQLNLETAFG